MQARRCPNPACGTMTQKVEGCLFLGCPKCREYWCWNCGSWGGGPSGREAPHHVFICADLPKDATWLDGHANLREDDARLDYYCQRWTKRLEVVQGNAASLEHTPPQPPESDNGIAAGDSDVPAVDAQPKLQTAANGLPSSQPHTRGGYSATGLFGAVARAHNKVSKIAAQAASALNSVEPLVVDTGEPAPQLSSNADKEDSELATAVAEARSVLLFGAAWSYFEKSNDKRKLFEFAEADLEQLLDQDRRLRIGHKVVDQTECPEQLFAKSRREATEREQRCKKLALASALRSQAQALRSYRRVGVS